MLKTNCLFTPPTAAALNVDTTQALPILLDLVPPGVTKQAGVNILCQSLGLTAEQVMAVGDGRNDLTMVANAGLGVAMGNAVTEVLEAADVVVSDNDNHGVAEALERLVLHS